MKKIFILLTILQFALRVYPQITRGTLPGEIYLSRTWYLNDENEVVYAVMRSTDNGEHLALLYSSTTMPEQGTGLNIVGDATPGVLYGYANDSLYVSNNYGISWNAVEKCSYENYGNYTSGAIAGEIYSRKLNQQQNGYALHKSIDFGTTFILINQNISAYGTEIGHVEGEVYNFFGPIKNGYPIKIYYSIDCGVQFNLQSTLNTDTAGYTLSGHYPVITRGAVPGELYLVTWHLPANYYIYYSSDYGQTFELQYQSSECVFYGWGFEFTAGRAPGSFYVMRNTGIIAEGHFHAQVYIDYSSDYAKTFTTYFHDLTSDYPFATSVSSTESKSALSNHPNPFSNATTIHFEHEGVLNIYDLNGTNVYTEKLVGNSRTIDLSFLKPGVYLYRIVSEGNISETNRMIKL